MITRLFRSFFHRIAAWYRIDRIRVSPTEGRLLGLKRGDRFVFRGEVHSVTERMVKETATGHEIVYPIESSQGRGAFWVQRDRTTGDVNGELIFLERTDPVFEDDIVLLVDEPVFHPLTGQRHRGSVPQVENRRSCGGQTAEPHRLATVATEFRYRA